MEDKKFSPDIEKYIEEKRKQSTIENLYGIDRPEEIFGESDFRQVYTEALKTNNNEKLIKFFVENDFNYFIMAFDYFLPFSSKEYLLEGHERLPYNDMLADMLKRMNEIPVTMMTDILYSSLLESYKMYCKAKASPAVNTNVEYENEFYDAEDWTVEFAEYERQIAEIKQECAARVKEINAKYNERKKEVARKHKITVTNINNAMKLIKMYATTEPENLTAEQKLFLTMYNTPEFCKVYKKSLEVSGIEVVNPEFGLGSNMYDKFEDKQPQPPSPQPKQEEVQHIQRSKLDIEFQEKMAEFKKRMGVKDDGLNVIPTGMSFEEEYKIYSENKPNDHHKWYLRHIPSHFDKETCKKVSYFFHRYLISNKRYVEGEDERPKEWIIREEIEDGLSLGNKILSIREYMNTVYEDYSDLTNKILDKLESIFGPDL